MNTFVSVLALMSVPVLASMATLVSGCRNLKFTVPEVEFLSIVLLEPSVGSDTTRSTIFFWLVCSSNFTFGLLLASADTGVMPLLPA